MSAFPERNYNVGLEAALVEAGEDNDSEYRLLVDNHHVKFVQTAPKTFCRPLSDRTDAHTVLRELLPPLPLGDWNHACVRRDRATGAVFFEGMRKDTFDGIQNLWHRSKYDEGEFTHHGQLQKGIRVCTHPTLNSAMPVLLKYAVWPWRISYMERETGIYLRIHSRGIGPRFLGHLIDREDPERAIGIITDYVQNARPATAADVDACAETLARLHSLRIKHGHLNKFSFAVPYNGSGAVLMNFENSLRNASIEELWDEMRELPEGLQGPDEDREGLPCDGLVKPLSTVVKVFKW